MSIHKQSKISNTCSGAREYTSALKSSDTQDQSGDTQDQSGDTQAPLISNFKCWNCFVHSFGGGYKVFILREDQLPPPSIKFYPNNLEH